MRPQPALFRIQFANLLPFYAFRKSTTRISDRVTRTVTLARCRSLNPVRRRLPEPTASCSGVGVHNTTQQIVTAVKVSSVVSGRNALALHSVRSIATVDVIASSVNQPSLGLRTCTSEVHPQNTVKHGVKRLFWTQFRPATNVLALQVLVCSVSDVAGNLNTCL